MTVLRIAQERALWSAERALGPLRDFSLRCDDSDDSPRQPRTLTEFFRTQLDKLRDTICLLFIPARTAFTLWFIAWNGAISPATGKREYGLRDYCSQAGIDVKNRIVSDEFLAMATQLDPNLLLQSKQKRSRDVLIADDIVFLRAKLEESTNQTQLCWDALSGRMLAIDTIAAYDFVDTDLEVVGKQLRVDPTKYRQQKLQELKSLIANRQAFLEENRTLAGRALVDMAYLHKAMNTVSLTTSVPLLPWSPMSKPTAVRTDTFDKMLFDRESWHWLEVTAAGNFGHGQRDYVLFPRGEVANRIQKALGDASCLVDMVMLHLSVSPRGFTSHMSMTPVVDLRPIKTSALQTWVETVVGKKFEEMTTRLDDERRSKLETQLLEEGTRYASFVLARRVSKAVTQYVLEHQSSWEIDLPKDREAVIPHEDPDYGIFLMGQALYEQTNQWLESPSDALFELATDGLIAAETWTPLELNDIFPGREGADYGYMGDSENGHPIYDHLMGQCPSAEPQNLDIGHLPEDGRCQNQFCVHYEPGILDRHEPRSIPTILEALKKRGVDLTGEQPEKKLRLYLLVITLTGFAVPTTRVGNGIGNVMYLRGESGQRFDVTPLGGQWAVGKETHAENYERRIKGDAYGIAQS